MSDLKPCPFCGGEAVHDYAIPGYSGATIECLTCNSRTERYTRDQDAIDAWNRRVSEADEASAPKLIAWLWKVKNAVPDVWAYSERLPPEPILSSLREMAIIEPLYAAPPSPAQAKGWRVKKLEWADAIAETSFGSYTVAEDADDDRWHFTFHTYPYGVPEGSFDTEEEAKAAAQANYEQRIRWAIEGM